MVRRLPGRAGASAHRRHSLYTDAYRAFVQDVPPVPADALERLREGEGTVLERISAFELPAKGCPPTTCAGWTT